MYVERFKNNVTMVEMMEVGHIFYSPGISGKALEDASNDELFFFERSKQGLITPLELGSMQIR